jgi:hypothetical protein
MACGAKTFNGKLGIDHEDHALDSLIDLAHTQGRATGVVTRDKLYGATPSAFLVNSEDRYDSATIATALIAGLPDFTLAGGRDVVLPLLDASATQILQTRAELLALVPDGRPIVGLFAPVEIPFVADLADTRVDPLAAAVRRILREKHDLPAKGPWGIPAVFSDEAPADPVELHYDHGQGFACVCPNDNDHHTCDERNVIWGTTSFVTGAVGLAAASVVVRALTGR